MLRRFTPEQAYQAFDACLGSVWDMKQRKVLGHSSEFHRWKRNAESAIARTYGEDSVWLRDFRAIPFELDEPTLPSVVEEIVSAHPKHFDRGVALLESMREEIQQEMGRQMSEESQRKAEEALNQETPLALSRSALALGGRVFVVHGRDDGTKEKVARLLGKLGLEPVILHEQVDSGRTVIEKIEKNSDVGFAVILLTADDVGKLARVSEVEKPRARQNVIFEFGYFIGRIGRNRVCALFDEGVEPPSDIAGFVYVPLDPFGAWRMRLVMELQKVGYKVDANKAL